MYGVAAVFGRGGGADLEDVGADGLGLGEELGFFDVLIENLCDLSAAVDEGAELRTAAECLQAH
ncbi:MAG: hypothetical protein ACYSPJ_02310 [Planctomycetota bacterium]